MKLYTDYCKIVDELIKDGGIRLAWFTTFSFSPAFAEHYLIPPLFKMNELPKSMKEYEVVNSYYQEYVREGKLDVRFFYDAHMLEEQSKRTTVPMHGILIPNAFFHPKVILLIGAHKSYLFVGSANIGINGWGRNREAVRIQQIKTWQQAREIVDFFNSIPSRTDSEFDFDAWIDTFSENSEDSWKFIFNTQSSKPFLEALNLQQQEDLYVWTPYFPKDTLGFVKEKFANTNLQIIPDAKDGKIRTDVSSEEFEKQHINLLLDSRCSGKELMTHAKIWLTSKVIAVGSYNFTRNALENNVEAAIIEKISQNVRSKFIDSLKSHESYQSMPSNELDSEEHTPMQRYTAVCSVTANWDKQIVDIQFFSKTLPCQLRLPGNIPLKKIDGTSKKNVAIILDKEASNKFFRALLSDRSFAIYDDHNNVLYEGLIIEEGFKYDLRQPYGYETINDALTDWLISGPNAKSSPQSLKYESKEDDLLEEIPSKEAIAIKHSNSISYYSLFAGFQNLRNEVDRIRTQKEWNFFVKGLPNIEEVKKLACDFIKNSEEQVLLGWFMVQEVNRLIQKLNYHAHKPSYVEEIDLIPETDIGLNKKQKKFIELSSRKVAYK